ncbi:MAG TPA: polysaccharide deacetylase family protein [Pyrinomonadaceae bacterium]|nr:polysaccharide deacetylase family protein [Pyrinomonadaceae bacterium]
MFDLATLSLSAGALSITSGAAYYATCAVRSQWLGEAVWHGRRDTSSVALTFDDGPADDTDALLDMLCEQNLKATFFMVGRQVERHPQLARRVVAGGHEVGNHSFSHPVYLYRSARETLDQLSRAQEVINQTTGVEPKLSRPPCGVRTPAYFAAARALKLRTVQWSDAGFDWKGIGASAIARNVLRRVRAGSIILLHDGDSRLKRDRRQTILSLPLIIEGLKMRGLKVAPLSELLDTV